MSDAGPQTPLGECIRHRSEIIRLDDRETYLRCRVQLNGRGVVLRDRVLGVDVKTKEQQVCRAGELLVAEIDAKMGGVGIVPDDLAGAIVSSHYFLFQIDESKLRRKFLDYYLRTPDFQTQVKARGSTNYSAIRPYHVLAYTIPLPLPDEQDRIVVTLDAAAARVAEATRLCREIDEEADALCRSILSDPRHPTTPTPMRELVTLRSPDVDVKAAESYHFAGIYCFGKGMFRGQTRLGAEFSYDTLSRVRAGDFTYPKLMAWEGALCVIPPECDGLYVSTEYPVFEINTDRVLPDVLDVYFRSPEVWPKLSGTSKGTNVRRRRLNPQQFLNYVMPLPEREVQERVAEVRAKLTGIKAQHPGLVTELEALMPAILDRAFKGELGGAALSAASALSAGTAPMIAGRVGPSRDVAAPSDGAVAEHASGIWEGANGRC